MHKNDQNILILISFIC